MLRRMREAVRLLRHGRSFVLELDVSPEEARRRIEASVAASEPDLLRLRPHWEGSPAEASFELRHFYLLNHPVLVGVTIEAIEAGCRLTARLRTPLLFRALLAIIGGLSLLSCAALLAQQMATGAFGLLVLVTPALAVFALGMDYNARTAERALEAICASKRIALGEGAYRAVRVRVEPEEAPAELPREAKKRDLSDISEL
jgi:hypothetical protein